MNHVNLPNITPHPFCPITGEELLDCAPTSEVAFWNSEDVTDLAITNHSWDFWTCERLKLLQEAWKAFLKRTIHTPGDKSLFLNFVQDYRTQEILEHDNYLLLSYSVANGLLFMTLLDMTFTPPT